jgi:hypothetical protein
MFSRWIFAIYSGPFCVALSRALANLFGVLRGIDRLFILRATAPLRFPDGPTTAVCLSVRSVSKKLVRVARKIWQRERQQADAIKSGHSLREQLEFAQYLEKRTADSSYTFREHLRKISGAIEE